MNRESNLYNLYRDGDTGRYLATWIYEMYWDKVKKYESQQ